MPKIKINNVSSDVLAKVRRVALWLQEKQASRILALDLGYLNSVSEAVLIASAANKRHAQALADWLLQKLGEQCWEFMNMEGYQAGTWILLDLNDLVVHIFQQEYRDFYNLEGLWSEASILWQDPEARKDFEKPGLNFSQDQGEV